ncbi:MAG: DUF21 domain-containing protein [Xanthomonadales bacterium]|nr:DUF21 domain-containing protein [Xanthomonadales bacterium]
MNTETLTWIGIAFCVTQSAMFSGLNLAFFSLTRLRLEVEAAAGNPGAIKVLAIRSNPNLVLTTVLLGNVSINVLLTLLSDSVLAGASAFLFSTVVITAFGEILPQAYFSRNALRVTSVLSPVFRVYQVVLYPIAGPVAKLLDRALGPEGLVFFRERQLRHLIRKHIEASEAEIDRIEGLGALNFLEIDDIPIVQEGEPLNPDSVISIDFEDGKPAFPDYATERRDAFLGSIQKSGEKWVIFVDRSENPRLVMDADRFLRDALFAETAIDPNPYCHRPIVVTDPNQKVGYVLPQWNAEPVYPEDNVIDRDLVLLWADTRKVITGADILGRLLMGIAGHHDQEHAL